MVAGHIHAEGSSMSEEKRVTFSLEERDQRDNVSLAPVRLVGGRTEREGRLQVCALSGISAQWLMAVLVLTCSRRLCRGKGER